MYGMDIGIISVTKQGDVLAQGLCEKLGARLYSKNTTLDFKFQQVTKTLMEECEALIFIASTGIAVRAIAPYLKGKDKDPSGASGRLLWKFCYKPIKWAFRWSQLSYRESSKFTKGTAHNHHCNG